MNVSRPHNLLLGISLVAICLSCGGVSHAATMTWVPTTAGTHSWNINGNWSPSTFPNAVDDEANVNIDIAGNQTINLNTGITIGTLNIGDAIGTSTITIAPNGGSLTFDVATGNAAFNKTAGGGNSTISTSVVLNDNLDATLADGVGTPTITGLISGNGGINRLGGASGTGGTRFILQNAGNSYAGDTVITAGRLRTNTATGSIPNGIGTGNLFIDSLGGLELNMGGGGNETINGLSGSGFIEHGGSNGIVMTLTVGDNDATGFDFSGVMQNQDPLVDPSTRRFNFAKIGAGVQTLSGNNTYNGTTTVSGGTLLVNGSHTPNFGTLGDYSVASGATLGGTGVIEAAVSVAAGGFLAPGASIESLDVNSATIAGTLMIEIDESDAFVNDLLNVVGALDIGAATLDFDITGGLTQAAYVIATYGAGGLTGPFASAITPTGYHLDYNYQGNNQIALVVPEPASLAMAILAVVGAVCIRRRQK